MQENDQLQENLNNRVKPDGIEMNLKRELSELNNEKDQLMLHCRNEREAVSNDLENIKLKARNTFMLLQNTQEKDSEMEIIENTLNL